MARIIDTSKPVAPGAFDGLRVHGLIPPHIRCFREGADYIGQTGGGPLDAGPPKRWRDETAISGSTAEIIDEPRYYIVPEKNPNGSWRVVDIRAHGPGGIGWSHPMWGWISPRARNFVGESLDVGTHKGVRPELLVLPAMKVIRLTGREAAQMNFAADIHADYPLAFCIPIESPEQDNAEFDGVKLHVNWWPSTILRFAADGGVEAVSIDAYPAMQPAAPIVGTGAGAPAPSGGTIVLSGGQVTSTVTPVVPAAPNLQGVAEFENAGFDAATGEMLSKFDPGTGLLQYVRTGWTFERVAQALPVGGANPDTNSAPQLISPWAFATHATAARLVGLLQPLMPGARIIVASGDQNARFPTNVAQLQLHISEGGSKTYRTNAGLIAQTIARSSVPQPDGSVKQDFGFLQTVVAEARRELATE